MTNRQRALIDYLIRRFNQNQNEYVSKEDIQQCVIDNNDFHYYINRPSKREGDSYRKHITDDVHAINCMDEEECAVMIISNSRGYKIATIEELKSWADNQRKSIERRCIKRNIMLRKYKLDGQLTLKNEVISPFAC